jgi:hypothetical protein
MQVPEWRKTIGKIVREHMRSPELEHYFSVKMNKPRAQLLIMQLGREGVARAMEKIPLN